MVEKINLKSEDILEENISKLKQIFPNVFSEGKIDFDTLMEIIKQCQLICLSTGADSVMSYVKINHSNEEILSIDEKITKHKQN